MFGSFYSTQSVVQDPFGLSNLRFNSLRRIMENERQAEAGKSPEKDFGKLLLQALNGVNDMQMKPYELTQQMITEPDSVNVHDITIASTKASLSLSITKELVERTIRAYKEIINTR